MIAPGAGFDPAAGLFVAQDRRPPELGDVGCESLSPLLRALLVIDGTVTKFLEAYSLEPVSVTRLDQYSRPLEADHPWLDAVAGEAAIFRGVVLTGADSGELYAWAESIILPARLPLPMQDDLDNKPGGLGKILLDSRLETRREGLWYGREPAAERPEAVARLFSGAFLHRSYRVIAGGVPLMLIAERFPIHSGAVARFERPQPI